MKIKHHPGINESLYPKLALVIIKLYSTIISTGKKKTLCLAANSFSWHEICGFFFLPGPTELLPRLWLLSGLLHFHVHHWTRRMWLNQARSSPAMIFKKNRRGYDSFNGHPLFCIIFIKVTLTVSTTQINYFILPLTSPKFFLHFNRGDLVGEGWSVEPLSGAPTPEGPLLDVTH